jgi:alpha-ribazole phosphatase
MPDRGSSGTDGVGMAVVHLIRHGAPARTGLVLGGLDIPLASEEISPSTLTVKSIFSSPKKRALRTAELLFPQRVITTVDELAEISMGEWEGKRWNEIEALWPELVRAKMLDWTSAPPPGGETWSAFVARVTEAWHRICLMASPIAIVAHAGVNAALAHLISGVDPLQFSQSYEEVITFETVRDSAVGKRVTR